MFFVCEAVSVPGTATVLCTGFFGPYEVYMTCSSILQSVYFISRFWCVSSGYYVSVVTHVCVCSRVHRGSISTSARMCRILKSCEHLMERSQPDPFFLPVSTCDFPAVQTHSRMLLLLGFLFLSSSASVPVLVFIVPAVEVDIECHNAARRHAGDQSPKESRQRL